MIGVWVIACMHAITMVHGEPLHPTPLARCSRAATCHAGAPELSWRVQLARPVQGACSGLFVQ